IFPAIRSSPPIPSTIPFPTRPPGAASSPGTMPRSARPSMRSVIDSTSSCAAAPRLPWSGERCRSDLPLLRKRSVPSSRRAPGPAGAQQARHLNLTIFARGLLRQLTTRIYFADDPSNETDPILAAVADPDARRTLVAARQGGSSKTALYRFDVILQGEGETAF